MKLNLSDTRLVIGLIALIMVCLTVLVALGRISPEQAQLWAGGVVSGVLVAWKRKDKGKADKADKPE